MTDPADPLSAAVKAAWKSNRTYIDGKVTLDADAFDALLEAVLKDDAARQSAPATEDEVAALAGRVERALRSPSSFRGLRAQGWSDCADQVRAALAERAP